MFSSILMAWPCTFTFGHTRTNLHADGKDDPCTNGPRYISQLNGKPRSQQIPFPIDKLIECMIQPKMIEETAKLMHLGLKKGAKVNVLVNNRAGGNAPLIAKEIAESFART